MVGIKYIVDDDWGSGFKAEIILTAGSGGLQGWTVEFDSTATITNLWNAGIVSHVGTHYVVTNESWNGQVPAGQAVSFGFQAMPGTAASGFIVNGVAADPPGVLPSLSIADASVAEGNSATRDLAFAVTLSAAATGPVTVAYATADGSATAASDYAAANGTLTFAAGETTKVIHVAVTGDTAPEPDETLKVTLSSPSGATIDRATATGTILNDDSAPLLTGSFALADTWTSGFSGTIEVSNGGAAATTSWQIELDMPYQITSIWNARIISQDATGYLIGNADWNGPIAHNGDAVFGFVASGPLDPSSVYVHGVDEAVTAVPTVPTGLLATAITSTSAWLSWLPSTAPGNAPLTGYTIFENGQQIATTTAPSYTVSNLAADTSYQFTVAASDAAGPSAVTSALSVHTAPDAGLATLFSPYVDMSLWPGKDDNLKTLADASGIHNYTLAFVVAVNNGTAIGWGGLDETITHDVLHDGTTILAGVTYIQQQKKGNVTVSFGGARGPERALSAPNATVLQAEYQSVIDRYSLHSIDFDIEGSFAQTDPVSLLKRDQAIVGLERANPGLKVSFTLSVSTTGLVAGEGLKVLEAAKRDGVRVDVVNIMAMDYGPSYTGSMGPYAISAAEATEQQIKALGLDAKIGITSMIGQNDTPGEIFQLADAHQVLDYAQSHPAYISQLGIWAMARDNGDRPGLPPPPDPETSSIVQAPWEFSHIFHAFDKP
jgi:hypothetical protein